MYEMQPHISCGGGGVLIDDRISLVIFQCTVNLGLVL